MKKRKSPRKHKVNTKHPRYDVPNYPRGSGSMPMSKPSSPQYGIKLTYPVAQKPHPQSTHLATRIRSLGRVTHWSESHIVVSLTLGKRWSLILTLRAILNPKGLQ